jgi:hypothetical protein
MLDKLKAYMGWQAADAATEFRAELREFAFDGLVELDAALSEGAVLRGTWSGCPLSYQRGHAGSADCDRKGRRGNAFTRFWDAERIEAERVQQMVREEIAARVGQLVAPNAPADTRQAIIDHVTSLVEAARKEGGENG